MPPPVGAKCHPSARNKLLTLAQEGQRIGSSREVASAHADQEVMAALGNGRGDLAHVQHLRRAEFRQDRCLHVHLLGAHGTRASPRRGGVPPVIHLCTCPRRSLRPRPVPRSPRARRVRPRQWVAPGMHVSTTSRTHRNPRPIAPLRQVASVIASIRPLARSRRDRCQGAESRSPAPPRTTCRRGVHSPCPCD